MKPSAALEPPKNEPTEMTVVKRNQTRTKASKQRRDSGCNTITTKDLRGSPLEELVRVARVAISTVAPPRSYIYMVEFQFGLEGKRRDWKLEGGELLERRQRML